MTKMACGILVLPEHFDGKWSMISFQLTSKGRELADALQTSVGALVLGSNVDSLLKELEDAGVDKIFVCDHPKLEYYNPEIYAKVVSEIVASVSPRLVLLGYTFWGIELGPAVSTQLKFPLLSNCVQLECDNDVFVATRPIHRGTRNARIEFPTSTQLVVSLQQGAVHAASHPKRELEIREIHSNLEDCAFRTKALEIIRPVAGEVDITQAGIIVAIGRGIKDKANIPLAKDLAERIGGVIACSRPLTDIGWLPLEYQVGISGKTVRPKIYIACGISGASHHLAGMKDSELIIAINNDPNAPIFQVAHYGVVGDLFEILPAIIQEARVYE